VKNLEFENINFLRFKYNLAYQKQKRYGKSCTF
jgi:hypothetical protein